jgi:hypothetical protein
MQQKSYKDNHSWILRTNKQTSKDDEIRKIQALLPIGMILLSDRGASVFSVKNKSCCRFHKLNSATEQWGATERPLYSLHRSCGDNLERDETKKVVTGERDGWWLEAFIHCSIHRSRPRDTLL